MKFQHTDVIEEEEIWFITKDGQDACGLAAAKPKKVSFKAEPAKMPMHFPPACKCSTYLFPKGLEEFYMSQSPGTSWGFSTVVG